MLADTENLLFSLSSTAAIIIDEVKWPYFFCHVYVSKETSFFSNRLIGRLGADGLRSGKDNYIYESKIYIWFTGLFIMN